MAGTIIADTLQDGSANSGSMTDAIKGSAKAWVNFNGIGTVAVIGSYNVSSITDLGVGTFSTNFTTAMADTNYAVAVVAHGWGVYQTTQSIGLASDGSKTVNYISFGTARSSTEALVDYSENSVIVHGN